MTWKPHVTVAAVIEHSGCFLCVEETIEGQSRLNQPAGHLEPGESLTDAVIREVREETTRGFTPEALVGVYLWRAGPQHPTFLRVTFTGCVDESDPALQTDAEIDANVWLSPDAIRTRRREWRSPLVMQCIDDYLAGQRYPLSLLRSLVEKTP
ncbi:MAG: NUDIX hydrolase [Gammaproteobacteria bacterium]|nr:NUDIX hydrolase [Gammaproteobacteria bacterium]